MIKFYNTLTRKEEVFKPITDNLVRIYTCGPTVYDYAHIGNLRSYIFADVLRRTLELAGFKVKQIINITDVGHLTSNEDEGEDKIQKRAEREQKTPEQIAAFYTKAFLSDLKKLNIEKQKILPKASEHIKEMIAMIEKIFATGYAYETKDGIYFDTKKFKDYGMLSRQKIDLERRSRVDKISGKKNPTDFALWLKTTGKHKSHIMKWDSPWGEGFPGWHIECSAMSQKYLGDEFDIHTGGVDHIPVHHENEIAQSYAANAKIPAKFWMHGEFLIVDKKRMGKSEGNLLTLAELEKKEYEPVTFRFLVLRNHYRSKIQFDDEKMREAKTALKFLYSSLSRLKRPQAKTIVAESTALAEKINQAEQEIKKSFFDDLNTPRVIDILFEMAHYLNKLKSEDKIGEAEIKDALERIYLMADKVLAINLTELVSLKKEIPLEILKLAEERQKAKDSKDFKLADKIRKEIEDKGFKIEDTRGESPYRIIPSNK
ncbi:MAG: cysteine--tRNA ligase [Candidatus Berkelbacteria bacterium]|nr:cysteine--tRNA ligase [Candidatus Berkelbacteria bacterium]